MFGSLGVDSPNALEEKEREEPEGQEQGEIRHSVHSSVVKQNVPIPRMESIVLSSLDSSIDEMLDFGDILEQEQHAGNEFRSSSSFFTKKKENEKINTLPYLYYETVDMCRYMRM